MLTSGHGLDDSTWAVYIAVLEASSEAKSAPTSDRTGALMSVESEVACTLSRPKGSNFVKTGMRLDTVRVSVRTQLRQADSLGSDRRGEIPDIAG